MNKRNKYGLYVGINKHSDAPLYGCVNDAIAMQNIDFDFFNFKKENSTLLLDQYATKPNVIKAMIGIFDKANSGDLIRLHFSTHGTQVPDTSKDEDDFVDEALIMYTPPGKLWWRDSIIRDDDFAYIIKYRMRPGVRLVCTFDCCHTGTGLRMIADPRVDNTSCCLARYMPPPHELAEKILDISLSKEEFKYQEKIKDPVELSRSPILNIINGVFDKVFPWIYGTNDKESALYKETQNYKTVEMKGDAILYSGCLSTEVAYDITRNGVAMGAMSSGFVQAVKNLSKNNFTYQQLYNETINVMSKTGDYPKQHPQLELDPRLRNEIYLK